MKKIREKNKSCETLKSHELTALLKFKKRKSDKALPIKKKDKQEPRKPAPGCVINCFLQLHIWSALNVHIDNIPIYYVVAKKFHTFNYVFRII